MTLVVSIKILQQTNMGITLLMKSLQTIMVSTILISVYLGVGVAELQCSSNCECQQVQIQSFRGEAIRCTTPDTLDTIPNIGGDRDTVLKIEIRDQTRLTHIAAWSLGNFTNLQVLEIESSGLEYIDDNAFHHNLHITNLHLRNNQIQRFQRRLVQHLSYSELLLEGNPLMCNCSNLWLGQDETIPAAGSNVTCLMDRGLKTFGNVSTGPDNLQYLVDVAHLYDHCETPNVTIHPPQPEAKDGGSINITCSTATTPGPLIVQWEGLDSLNSQYQVLEEEVGVSRLQIINLDTSDHYKKLTCKVSNDVSTRVANARIFILHPPRIEDMPVIDGPIIRVKIFISGWPKPRLTWYKDGRISPSWQHIKDYFKNTPEDSGLWKAMREFEKVVGTITGNYTVKAENSEGSSNATVEVNGLSGSVLESELPWAIKSETGHSGPHGPDGGHRAWTKDKTFGGVNSTDGFTTDMEHDSQEDLLIIILPSVIGALSLIIILLTVMMCFRRRRRKSRVMGRCDRKVPFTSRKQDFHEVVPLTGVQLVENPNYETRNKKGDKRKIPGYRHIKLETILLIQQIGEGEFGYVLLGKCAHLFKKDEFTNVAVKVLKGDSEEAIKRDFEKEADLLATLQHPNIVTFFGVCTEGEQLMMLFEFMEYGDLNNFLRSYGPHSAMLRQRQDGQTHEVLTIKQLLNIVIQISKGMEYLASQHFVHRDLATRNCLVGQGHVVKIGDFGMSKDVYSTDYYKVGNAAVLPIRWMPPESVIYRTFTVKSDVWSFGVTLWEVFTYGTQPWFEYSNMEVVDKIKNCIPLSRPGQCPDGVYNLMTGCWKASPADRLTMKEIYRLLELELELLQPSYLDVIE